MGFEVPPERIGRRGSIGPGIAIVVGAIAIVAAAVITGAPTQSGPTTSVASLVDPSAAPSPPTAVPARSPASATSGGAAGGALSAPRPIPPVSATECHDISSVRCRTIVVAAVQSLPDEAPRVRSVEAWGTLACGDSRDCPPSRLEDHRALGSAIVTFGPGRAPAMVNVAARTPGSGCPCGIVAWIIRWDG